jgi:hypothetical protein
MTTNRTSKKTTRRLKGAIADDVAASRKPKPDKPMTPARKQAIAEIDARIERLEGKKPGKPKAVREKKPDKPKRVSALDAAAQVLTDAAEPMGVNALVEEMGKRGLWSSPGGKTPGATLNAAIIREIATKAEASRFRKVDRGLFAANKHARAVAA